MIVSALINRNPAFYFSIDSHAPWIAVDLLVDRPRALRYDPPTGPLADA